MKRISRSADLVPTDSADRVLMGSADLVQTGSADRAPMDKGQDPKDSTDRVLTDKDHVPTDKGRVLTDSADRVPMGKDQDRKDSAGRRTVKSRR